MGRHAKHYHIVAADIIGSSRFLSDGRDDLYTLVLDDFYRMVRKTQIILSKRHRFIERDRLAGIYPIGGDSFWMFIPASNENCIVEDSFAFVINALDSFRRDFATAFSIHGLGIRIGVHTTIKEKLPDGSMGWVAMDEGIDAPRRDLVYKMPLFNRIFRRDFVVAKRLEQAAGEIDNSTHVLFSREFVLRMLEFGGTEIVNKSEHEIKLKNKSGLEVVFKRHATSDMKTSKIQDKLRECKVDEVYELMH
jgi:hypothetical protein